MARVEPLPRAELAEYEEHLAFIESVAGFVPNSMMTMARVPGLLDGFRSLTTAAFGSGLLDPGLVQMVALMSSYGGGCRYCQAHTSKNAARLGVDEAKLADIGSFESDDRFTDAERAALRLAFHAGQVPNAVTDDDVEACRAHFDEAQITAIVAVCATFGFLNRWNDTMATQLEDLPTAFAARVLGPSGWNADKHGAPPS